MPAAGAALTISNPRAVSTSTLPPVGNGERHRLDLATLYTISGLLGGSPKMPVPSSVDGRLYVPAGAAGTAMANLAARLGLETTGVTVPLALPAPGVAADKVGAQAVIAGGSPLATAVDAELRKQNPVWSQESSLKPGEGLVRIVDDALGTQSKEKDAPTKKDAILVRGDAQGSAAALDLLANHFPNLWDYGKQHLSLEEIRYDLHRFFSLRSGVGQAAVALYHLDRWMDEIAPPGEARRPAQRARERNGASRERRASEVSRGSGRAPTSATSKPRSTSTRPIPASTPSFSVRSSSGCTSAT